MHYQYCSKTERVLFYYLRICWVPKCLQGFFTYGCET